jgi:hypothetical protein
MSVLCANGEVRAVQSAFVRTRVRITIRAGARACDIRSGNVVAVRSDFATRLLIVVVTAIHPSVNSALQVQIATASSAALNRNHPSA